MIFGITRLANNSLYFYNRILKSYYYQSFEESLIYLMNINFAISIGLFVFVLPFLRLSGILNLLFNFFTPTVKISKDNNNLCMICLDDKNNNDLFKSCQNNHFYHKECINQ